MLSGSLKSNLVFFSNPGAAYVTRFNDVPASTGYGDPVQKLFKFDDGERVVGALSLDAAAAGAREAGGRVASDGFGLRFALAPHTEVSTRVGPPLRQAGRGRRDHRRGAGAPRRTCSRWSPRRRNALVCKVDEVNELAGPGRGVTVIKVADDDEVMAFLCTSRKDAAISLETDKGKTLELSPGRYEVTVARRQGPRDVEEGQGEVGDRARSSVVALPAGSKEPASRRRTSEERQAHGASKNYDATNIQVLEGLEPVRKRPAHVHRRHRRRRLPPPAVGDRRQLGRRGDQRPRHRASR